jgi:hypothetical protein
MPLPVLGPGREQIVGLALEHRILNSRTPLAGVAAKGFIGIVASPGAD